MAVKMNVLILFNLFRTKQRDRKHRLMGTSGARMLLPSHDFKESKKRQRLDKDELILEEKKDDEQINSE